MKDVLMAVYFHSGGVLLGVDRILDVLVGDETKASRFFPLLVVDKLAALERINEIYDNDGSFYLEFSISLECAAEFVFSGSSTEIENT